MASIVERESLFDADRPTIAGVFKKRLAHGIPLQSDATISYVLGYAKENVTIGDTQLQSPYNTYVSKGLPPGPIANPGKKALDAVLYAEDTDYLYFVADKEGHNHFSKTYAEHLAEVEKIYGADKAAAGSSNQGQAPALAQAGPNYDVAATSEPDYNYSSAEAVAADSQYVDVEPTYTYTPTTVPATTQPTPTPAAPAAERQVTTPSPSQIPESMQQVIPQQSAPVQSAPAAEEPRVIRSTTQTAPSTGNSRGGVDR